MRTNEYKAYRSKALGLCEMCAPVPPAEATAADGVNAKDRGEQEQHHSNVNQNTHVGASQWGGRARQGTGMLGDQSRRGRGRLDLVRGWIASRGVIVENLA